MSSVDKTAVHSVAKKAGRSADCWVGPMVECSAAEKAAQTAVRWADPKAEL